MKATKKEKDVEVIAAVINIPEINILAYASYKHGAFINNKRAKVSTYYGQQDESYT